MNTLLIKSLLLVCIISLVVQQPAFAYLDPGTGSMIVQIIVASFVGIGCTFKIWKNKLISVFKSRKK